MTPTLLVLPAGAYTNQSNAWVFIYGTDTCTMTDASGKTLDIQNLPTWLPPGATITPTNSGSRMIALMADHIEDFRGFLSKKSGAAAMQQPFASAFSVGSYSPVSVIDIAEHESNTAGFGQWGSVDGYYWKNPVGGNSGQTTGGFGEAEAWSHSP